jgi:glucose/arabinose dehydrogenase
MRPVQVHRVEDAFTWLVFAPRFATVRAVNNAAHHPMKRLSLLAGSLSLCATLHAAEPLLDLKLIAGGFVSPLICESLPGGGGALIVGDQPGTAHIVGKDGKVREKLFLDLRPKMTELKKGFDERGLLGLAFHPKFKDNGRFFVCYSAPRRDSAPADWDHTMNISEFKVMKGDNTVADPASERVLLAIDQPYFNHNGGSIAFGPDGFLYIASGDGGNAHDIDAPGRKTRGPLGNAQDLSNLMGKILRIDVNSGNPYGIPKDNPFADGKKGKPEIYAYGIRNPWRMSFDMDADRKLIWGEVGQTMFEEVNVGKLGANYGWNIREGFHGFDPQNPKAMPDKPKTGHLGEPLVDPILEYKNGNGFPKDPEGMGISITGGYIYRGSAIPSLVGKYIFGDWQAIRVAPGGALFVASPPKSKTETKWTMDRLKLTGSSDEKARNEGKLKGFVVAFGQDSEGEVYVLTNDKNGLIEQTGKVWKLVAK